MLGPRLDAYLTDIAQRHDRLRAGLRVRMARPGAAWSGSHPLRVYFLRLPTARPLRPGWRTPLRAITPEHHQAAAPTGPGLRGESHRRTGRNARPAGEPTARAALIRVLRSSAPVCAYLAALAVAFSVVMGFTSQIGASIERVTPATTQRAQTSVLVPSSDLGTVQFWCRTPGDLLAALVAQDESLGQWWVQHAFLCDDRRSAVAGGG